jgi:hypothetical protein
MNNIAPSNPKEGDMYFDPNTGKNNMYHKGKWFELELKFNMPKNFERKEKIKAILK